MTGDHRCFLSWVRCSRFRTHLNVILLSEDVSPVVRRNQVCGKCFENSRDEPGQRIRRLFWSVVGYLLTTTMCSLFIPTVIYDVFGTVCMPNF